VLKGSISFLFWTQSLKTVEYCARYRVFFLSSGLLSKATLKALAAPSEDDEDEDAEDEDDNDEDSGGSE
jgi:hypothetical protein